MNEAGNEALAKGGGLSPLDRPNSYIGRSVPRPNAKKLMAGRGTVDRYYPVVADTIFFLSDGAPTIKGSGDKRGLGRDSVEEILAAVQRWNPLGRVVIHSIGLGVRGGARSVLRRAKSCSV